MGSSVTRIIASLASAEKSKIKYNSKCDSTLKEIMKFVTFDTSENRFYVEYQDSDGFVLADDDTNVYHLGLVIDHIKENGSINSYQELKSYRI